TLTVKPLSLYVLIILLIFNVHYLSMRDFSTKSPFSYTCKFLIWVNGMRSEKLCIISIILFFGCAPREPVQSVIPLCGLLTIFSILCIFFLFVIILGKLKIGQGGSSG